MKIEIIKCLKDNYAYLIIDETKQDACVIDPSEAEPIINFVENKKINLKNILNTHHHYDHVGGNLELKKKYNCNVIGFIGDKDRIPEVDILVEDKQIWKDNNFEAKIYHIPGHTTGHISYHFFKEKKIFTGDTLFSLGCGRIFEGTYEQMFNSLNKIKKLPPETEIYCGHEYTLQNSNFCLANDSKNLKLKEKIIKIKNKLKNDLPTIPTILRDEIDCNIFLKAKDLKSFSKLRDLKDNFQVIQLDYIKAQTILPLQILTINTMSYAVIQTGGKQYKVKSGEILKIEKLPGTKTDAKIEFKEILAYGDDKIIEVGSPIVAGAKVEADLVKNGKNRTILIFKKRRRQNSRTKNGHRQEYSMIRIKKIFSKDGKVLSEAEKKAVPNKKTAVAKKEVKK